MQNKPNNLGKSAIFSFYGSCLRWTSVCNKTDALTWNMLIVWKFKQQNKGAPTQSAASEVTISFFSPIMKWITRHWTGLEGFSCRITTCLHWGLKWMLALLSMIVAEGLNHIWLESLYKESLQATVQWASVTQTDLWMWVVEFYLTKFLYRLECLITLYISWFCYVYFFRSRDFCRINLSKSINWRLFLKNMTL